MFIGHFAAAMTAKRAAPRASLGLLVAAAQWPDLLWPVLLLTGVENVEVAGAEAMPLRFTYYPWSHSLVAIAAWAVLWGAVVWWRLRAARIAVVAGALVASHWLLDWLVHVPDLPLTIPGYGLWGLGLWRWPLSALMLELGLFMFGVLLYRGALSGQGRRPRWPFYGLCAFLVVIQLANALGPPPPGVAAVAWSGIATWLLVAWAWWADRR